MSEVELKDMEVMKLQKGDIVVVRPKEGYAFDQKTFHKGLEILGEKTGIKFLAADMVNVAVLRKEVEKDDINLGDLIQKVDKGRANGKTV